MKELGAVTHGEFFAMIKNASMFVDPKHQGLDVIKIIANKNGVHAFSTNKMFVSAQRLGRAFLPEPVEFTIYPGEGEAVLRYFKSIPRNSLETIHIESDGERVQFRHLTDVILQVPVRKSSPVLDVAIDTFIGKPRERISHPAIAMNREIFRTLGKLVFPDRNTNHKLRFTTLGNYHPTRKPTIVLDIGNWLQLTFLGIHP